MVLIGDSWDDALMALCCRYCGGPVSVGEGGYFECDFKGHCWWTHPDNSAGMMLLLGRLQAMTMKFIIAVFNFHAADMKLLQI